MYRFFPIGKKHRDQPLTSVPSGYLEFVLQNWDDIDDRNPGLSDCIRGELERRIEEEAKRQFAELLEQEKQNEIDESDYVKADVCKYVRGFRWDVERHRLYILVHRHNSLYHVWLSAEELAKAGLEPLG